MTTINTASFDRVLSHKPNCDFFSLKPIYYTETIGSEIYLRKTNKIALFFAKLFSSKKFDFSPIAQKYLCEKINERYSPKHSDPIEKRNIQTNINMLSASLKKPHNTGAHPFYIDKLNNAASHIDRHWCRFS